MRYADIEITPRLLQNFWSKVQMGEGCWIWLAYKDKDGYGRFAFKNGNDARNLPAHSMAWVLAHGPIEDGLEVCHNCPSGDNAACCNPAHLWLGTRAQNQADMARKGRAASGDRNGQRLHPGCHSGANHWMNKHPEMLARLARGSAHHNAKLTEESVREIHKMRVRGDTYKVIGQKFGVDQSLVMRIVRGDIWRHVYQELADARSVSNIRSISSSQSDVGDQPSGKGTGEAANSAAPVTAGRENAS